MRGVRFAGVRGAGATCMRLLGLQAILTAGNDKLKGLAGF